MRRESDYAKCKFIMTRDELGYSEILDDFKNAEFIYIVTFNISKNDETLLQKINESPQGSENKLFTNIPSRYNQYYNRWVTSNARNQIDSYITKLNPENFSAKFQSIFVFNNHSKIVMTNNLAYIGSANYSSESANNFESGVIFEDENVILQIKNIIDEEINSTAVPYYAYNIFPLIFLARELEEIRTLFNEEIWGMWEAPGGKTGDYFRGADIYLDTEFIDTFENLIEELSDAVSDLIREIQSNNPKKRILIGQLIKLRKKILNYKIEPEIIKFAEFDETDFIDEKVEENGLYMTEDVLDEYMQSFSQQAWDLKCELSSDAQDGLIEMDLFLKEATQAVMKVVSKLKEFINEEIDNT